jgi:hypothetical protein
VDEHLSSAFRALRERVMLLRRMASVAQGTDDPRQAAAIQAQADRIAQQAADLELLMKHEVKEESGSSA